MEQRGFLARLRYAFDKSMAAGTVALIAWLFLVSILIILLAATLIAVARIAPAGDDQMSFLEAFWASLMRTLDPGTMGGDQGWSFRIVMLLVTLGGIFIVSALIGVISTGLAAKLDQLRKGRSLVLEKDHTIIFNWSETIFDVIERDPSVRAINAALSVYPDATEQIRFCSRHFQLHRRARDKRIAGPTFHLRLI